MRRMQPRSRAVMERVKRLRKQRQLTQADFAELVRAEGVRMPWHVVANLETGRRAGVLVDELCAFAVVLDVPVAELLEPT